MAKTTDFPSDIREFGKLLDGFGGRFYDYEVFSDFIDYLIACFKLHGDLELIERLKNKYGKDYPKFIEMYRCFFLTHQELLGPGDDNVCDWFDTLGTVYEAITSRSKSSALGQFFTPVTVCDFMAQITYTDHYFDGNSRKGLRVNDCACGSGRTLLAFNKVAPGNRLYGEDLDPIASKMCAINLALHGCKGQVSNMDSLQMKWYWGFEINPFQHTMMGMPHIVPIRETDAHVIQMWQGRRMEQLEELGKKADEVKPKPLPVVEAKAEQPMHDPNEGAAFGQQLTLF